MKKYLFAIYLFALALVAVVGWTSVAVAASAQGGGQKKTVVRITAGDTILYATLNNTKTAQDFIATLPRTLPECHDT